MQGENNDQSMKSHQDLTVTPEDFHKPRKRNSQRFKQVSALRPLNSMGHPFIWRAGPTHLPSLSLSLAAVAWRPPTFATGAGESLSLISSVRGFRRQLSYNGRTATFATGNNLSPSEL
jgi:hypothetical protein